jgi:1-phosphatidylinositol-4-phosphate 5-kinase
VNHVCRGCVVQLFLKLDLKPTGAHTSTHLAAYVGVSFPCSFSMTPSLEVSPFTSMPFIVDGSPVSPNHSLHDSPTLYPPVGESPHSLRSHPLSSPPKPQRTQSATALPLPVRAILPVIDTSVAGDTHHPIVLSPSPRRQRASTGVSRPGRTSLEQRPTEDDVSWWTEEIHKRREIRRRWREAEDENMVIIGNKVDTNHPNYVTAYNMLTGLRVAVQGLGEGAGADVGVAG